MGGSDQSTNMISTGQLAFAAGYHVVRANMRGSGASFEICPRLYNAGLEGDLLAVALDVARQTSRIAFFGASLGANHVLLALGRSKKRLPEALRAAVAVSPPVDLARGSDSLHAPSNRIYMSRFAADLNASYARVQVLSRGYYEAGRERGVRTVREFDERITAPYGGFASAGDYYTRSSSGPWLGEIDRPTLILSAKDDPIIPVDSIRGFPLPNSGVVTCEFPGTGGHVGFVARTRAPGRFWAAERALDFLGGYLS